MNSCLFKIIDEIHIVEKGSWKGTVEQSEFSESKKESQVRFKDKVCPICLIDYLPTEIVLCPPCGHRFHAACIEKWDKQICPLDQRSLTTIHVEIIGLRIMFPSSTQAIAKLICQEKSLNLAAEIFLEKIYKDKPTSFRALLIFDKTYAIVQEIIQDVLNAYEGSLSVENFQDKARVIIQEIDNWLTKQSAILKWDLTEIGANLSTKKLANITRRMLFFLQISLRGDSLDNERVKKSIFFLNTLRDLLFNSTSFQIAAKKADQLFLLQHLSKMKRVSNQGKYDHISKLDRYSVERLNRLSSSIPKSPTCQIIREISQHIMKQQRRLEIFKSVGTEIKEWITILLADHTIAPITYLALAYFGCFSFGYFDDANP